MALPRAQQRESWPSHAGNTSVVVPGTTGVETSITSPRHSLIGPPLRDNRDVSRAFCAEDAPDPNRRGRERRKLRAEDRRRHRSVPARNENVDSDEDEPGATASAMSTRPNSTTSTPREASLAEMKRKQSDCHQKLLRWKQRMLMAEDLRREQLMLRAWHLLSLEDGERRMVVDDEEGKLVDMDANNVAFQINDARHTQPQTPEGQRKEYRFITKSGQVKTTRRHRRLATHPRRGETVIQVAPRKRRGDVETNKNNREATVRPDVNRNNDMAPINDMSSDSYDAYQYDDDRKNPCQKRSTTDKADNHHHRPPFNPKSSTPNRKSTSNMNGDYHSVPSQSTERMRLAAPVNQPRISMTQLRLLEDAERCRAESSGSGGSAVRSPPLSPEVDFEREIDELESMLGWPKIGETMTPADWLRATESARSSRISSSSSPSSLSSSVAAKARSMRAVVGSQPVNGVHDEKARTERNRMLGMAQVIAQEAKQERKDRRENLRKSQEGWAAPQSHDSWGEAQKFQHQSPQFSSPHHFSNQYNQSPERYLLDQHENGESNPAFVNDYAAKWDQGQAHDRGWEAESNLIAGQGVTNTRGGTAMENKTAHPRLAFAAPSHSQEESFYL